MLKRNPITMFSKYMHRSVHILTTAEKLFINTVTLYAKIKFQCLILPSPLGTPNKR